LITRCFWIFLARKRVARMRAKNKLQACLLRFVTQQKILPKMGEYLAQIQKLKESLFPF